MTKAGIYNKRVNGKMRRVQINAKGQWKFLKGKPQKSKTTKSGSHKSKPHKSKSQRSHKKRSTSTRRRGLIWG